MPSCVWIWRRSCRRAPARRWAVSGSRRRSDDSSASSTVACPPRSILANPGISQLAAARLLLLLQLLQSLEWRPPPERRERGNPVEETCKRILAGNLFDAVGGHYSTAPARLRGAYEATLAEYGPGSAAHQRSPVHAAAIVEQAKRAWQVLRHRNTRRSYRVEVLHIDVRAAAALLIQEAKVALLRNAVIEAREALAAAFDLQPSSEALNRWRELGPNPDGSFAPEHAERPSLEDVPAVRPHAPGAPPPARPRR